MITSIKMDKELHEKIKIKADKEMRSVSKQIILMITDYLEREERENAKQSK